jgi:prepilin-type processing-associated H-X9-DG protein
LSFVASAGLAGEKNQNKADGIFIDRVATEEFVTIDNILDGKSNTLLLSENVQATQWTAAGKRDTVFVWHATTTPAVDMRINGGDLKAPLTDNTARPSSYHLSHGVNVAFADTHIITLNEKVDYKVYIQLATPNGRASSMPAAWGDYILADEDYK